ncbi:MAG: MFS transporter [Deltaproteobacteria bacterium]|nr:MFS transporter [Deltaproteobacteria bacterium]
MATENIPLLRAKEKFGYSLGDFASNLFWMTFVFYGMFFYTDVFGIPAAAVGTMFLVTKLWDAINDPMMGIISDRTNTKWGKYRPYLLWMFAPFGIIGFMAFSTPEISVTGKIIYAYITYTMMMMVYTAINIPYSALMGVLTPSSKDRTSISTYRFAAAFAGGIFVQAVTLPMVAKVGDNSTDVITVQKQGEYNLVLKEQGVGTVQVKAIFESDNPPLETWQKKLMFQFSNLFTDMNKMEKTTNVWVNSEDRLDEIKPKKEQTAESIAKDPTFIEGNFYLPKGFKEKSVDLKDLFLEKINPNDEGIKTRKIDWTKPVKIRVIDQQSGFQATIGLFAVLAMALFFLTFLSTKERVKPSSDAKSSVAKDIKDVVTNVPWILVGLMGLFTLAQVCIRAGAIMYYFKYYVKDTSPATAFMLAGTITNLLGVLATDWLTRVMGSKKMLYMVFSFLTAGTMLPFMFIGADNLLLMFILTAIGGFLSGPLSPIVWAMYADIADYSEWKKGTRATGLFFSAATFAQKMGWTLGGAAAGWLLAAYGFEANIEQSAETITGIKALMSWIPAIGCVFAGAVVIFYKLNDKFMEQVVSELEERRSKENSAEASA